MSTSSLIYSYGPVPSRRLGKSLGINNIPAKVCSYSCVYCQVGRTTQMEDERRSFYKPEDIFRDVRNRVAKAKQASEQVDYVAFVPDGEPTLDVNLGNEIKLLKTLEVPVAVITNSSLLWRDDVKEELGEADWVSVKIDALEEGLWRRVNRPHQALRLSSILDGLQAFSKTFDGKLVTETMLVSGLNDSDDCLREVAGFIQRLQPSRSYLSVPTRPPAMSSVCAPAEEILNRAYQLFAEKVKRVEYLIGYEGNDFAVTGDIERDLLGITAVHPMRKEAVTAFLSRAGVLWEVVDRLVARGDLTEIEHDGHIFYLRKFSKDREAAQR